MLTSYNSTSHLCLKFNKKFDTCIIWCLLSFKVSTAFTRSGDLCNLFNISKDRLRCKLSFRHKGFLDMNYMKCMSKKIALNWCTLRYVVIYIYICKSIYPKLIKLQDIFSFFFFSSRQCHLIFLDCLELSFRLWSNKNLMLLSN